ncbi:MAG: TonB-dependent receptor [Gammaproteobacteria bacterium]|nr:TonB-dependent receptor [Gammaproteobacteria bacterium]
MKTKIHAGTVLAISVVTASHAAHAAEQTEPVIVTATRTAQIADQSVAPVIVIDRQALERNPGADLTDLLRMYTGIEIGRYGGPGQTASIFLRGTNSTQTLVMIDGVKLNSGTAGVAAIQNIDPSVVDHIEVVMGPRSTLYGSEAIGGVINIITKRQTVDGSQYSAAAGGGSYGTRDIKLAAHNHQGDSGAGIEAGYTKSNGFPTRADSNIDRGYDNLNVHVYGSKRIGDTRYDVSHWQTSGNTEYLTSATNAQDQDFLSTATMITAKTPMSATWLSTLKLSHVSDKLDQNQYDVVVTTQKDFAHTSRYSLDWQNDLQWNPQNLLTAGLYRAQEDTTAFSFGSGYDTNNYTNAVFAQNVRTTTQTTLITGLRYTNNQIYGDYTTWNLEYGLNLTQALRMTLASNSGFRAPDSNDLYGSGGNPDLKPETSQNSELGLRYQITPAQRVSLNVFRNKITNLIIWNNVTSMVDNIGQVTITGSELAYQVSSDHWAARLRASVQNPHDDITNSQLVRRAQHAYGLMLQYHGNKYDVSLDTIYSGERPDFNINTYVAETLPSYTLVNLSGAYRVSEALRLSLRIENLTDADYQVVDGYNTAGRSAYAELRYTL